MQLRRLDLSEPGVEPTHAAAIAATVAGVTGLDTPLLLFGRGANACRYAAIRWHRASVGAGAGVVRGRQTEPELESEVAPRGTADRAGEVSWLVPFCEALDAARGGTLLVEHVDLLSRAASAFLTHQLDLALHSREDFLRESAIGFAVTVTSPRPAIAATDDRAGGCTEPKVSSALPAALRHRLLSLRLPGSSRCDEELSRNLDRLLARAGAGIDAGLPVRLKELRRQTIDLAESRWIRRILELADGDAGRASQLLGISRKCLSQKARHFELALAAPMRRVYPGTGKPFPSGEKVVSLTGAAATDPSGKTDRSLRGFL